MIRVGPAGWSYPDWEGRVYPALKPPGFHPLVHLARFFEVIEIDSTFYAMPRREHVERWARLVVDRPRFRFFVKLHRDFTHSKGAVPADADAWEEKAAAFLAATEPLRRARKLAGFLVQFPVTFLHGKNEVRRIGRIRSLFPDVPLVLEVRHQSWFTPPAIDTLRGLSYSLAHLDLPAAWNHPPDWHEPTGPIGYLRLHGRNGAAWFRAEAGRDDRYDYLYATAELDGLAAKARRIASGHDETAVVMNNHFSGKAVANAIEILFLLRQEKIAAPSELVSAFPHLAAITRSEGQQDLFA
jgi:uncharacterized protein YecE (DUF72 family)